MSKVTFILEDQDGEVRLTLDLRQGDERMPAGRLAGELYADAMQRMYLARIPACYRHPPSNTIH